MTEEYLSDECFPDKDYVDEDLERLDIEEEEDIYDYINILEHDIEELKEEKKKLKEQLKLKIKEEK